MERKLVAAAFASLLLLLALTACSSGEELDARFVRYETLPDKSTAAVVAIPAKGSPSEDRTASTDLTDLHAGDPVLIRYVGKDWDEPQWRPDWEVVRKE